jgi:hypothetical protein
MSAILNTLSFVIACLSGWLNERQQSTIDYLTEENRVLREQIGNRRLRFSDDQRRRLAVRAKQLSRSVRTQVATIVTPETLLAWHRKLIAAKYFEADPPPLPRWRRKSGYRPPASDRPDLSPPHSRREKLTRRPVTETLAIARAGAGQ